MLAEWIGEDVWVGPKWKPSLAIKKGEVREVLGITQGKYMLAGRMTGSFGWTERKNLRIIEDDFLQENEMRV